MVLTRTLLGDFGIAGLLPSTAILPELDERPCDSANPSPFCAFTRDEQEEKALHWALRLASTGGGPWGWTAGVSYRDWESEASSREFSPRLSRFAVIDPPVQKDLEYLSEGRNNETRRELFGALSRLRVFAGARWFRIDQATGGVTEFPFTPYFDNPYTKTASSHDGALVTVGAAYRLGGDRFVHVTRAEGRGADAGGSNPFPGLHPGRRRGGQGGRSAELHEHQRQVKPDAVTNYEIGLRGSWLDGRVAVNGSVFHTEWADARMSGRTPFSKQIITQNTETSVVSRTNHCLTN